MGIQESQPQKSIKPQQKSNYYGGQLIHNPKTNTTYQKFVIEQKQEQKFLSLIRSRQKLQHPNFITVKNQWKKQSDKRNFSCTNDKGIQIFVEYQALSQSLSKKLDKYSQTSQIINEPQLISIFTSIISCLFYLKSCHTCHGDIKPQSIYFDSLNNIKLMDSFFMNGGRTSYQIVMENPSSMSLLSPEQLTKLKDKQFDDISFIYHNQVFSVGLTMYECMTFEPAMECYDLEKLNIKKDFFRGKEHLMYANGYSTHLVDLVMSLILKPASTRLTLTQLYDVLSQFSH